MNTPLPDREAARFEELLTPYVQDQLDAETRRAVERYAESSAEFASLLRFEERVAGSVKTAPTDPVVQMPSFQTLRKRIEQPAQSNGATSWVHRVQEMLRAPTPWLAAASFAAITVAVFIAPRAGVMPSVGVFETLSTDEVGVVPTAARLYFRIVPAPEATQGVSQLSSDLGFTVETGPDTIGSYIVSTADDANEALTTWRNDHRIVFVERIRFDVAE